MVLRIAMRTYHDIAYSLGTFDYHTAHIALMLPISHARNGSYYIFVKIIVIYRFRMLFFLVWNHTLKKCSQRI